MKRGTVLPLLLMLVIVFSKQMTAQTTLGDVIEGGGTGYPSGSNPAYLGVDYGVNNFVLGPYAARLLTSGDSNTALGRIALQVATTTSGDTAVGYGALTSAVSANFTTAVGYLALSALVGSGTGDSNGSVAVGYEALENATGKNNVGVGAHALIAATGNRNTAVGTDTSSSGLAIGSWSGSDNTAMGHDAMAGLDWEEYLIDTYANLNVSGSQNACFGEGCLAGLSTASNNVGTGYEALGSNATGNDNVGIGYYAGVTDVDANRNISGSQNVWVGREAGASTPAQPNNCVAVGYRAKCSQSNQAVIGNSSTTQAIVHGDPHFWSVFVPGNAYACGSTADGNPVGDYTRCGFLSLPIAMTVTQISFSFASAGSGYGAGVATYTVFDGTNKCSVPWAQFDGAAQPTTGTPTGTCSFAAGAKLAIVVDGSYSATLDAQNANVTVTLTP